MITLFAAHTNIENFSEMLIAVGVGILIFISIYVFLAKHNKNKK